MASDAPRARRPRRERSPERGAQARLGEVVNRYDAAGFGRRIASWRPPASGPNRALRGLNVVRSRARDAVRNDWRAEAGVTKHTTSLVGIGIRVHFDQLENARRRKVITQAFVDWCRVCDADGVLDYYGMQTLAVRSWLESGEVFARLRDRPVGVGPDVPLQVQLIESDFVPYFDSDAWPGMPAGNRIRQGIELTKYGERVAYWMYRSHPTDTPADATTVPNPLDLIRVPADQVLHVFKPRRPGQLRGVSALAAILIRLRNTGDFEDVVLDRQKLANLFTLFVTRELPPDSADIDYDPDTGLPKFYQDDGQPVATLEAGMTQELAPGEKPVFANPPEAGTMFSDYLRTTDLGTAAGGPGGMPYELFSGDIRNVSDRTLRVLILEYRRLCEAEQWQVIIPMFCQRVVDRWVAAAALVGIVRTGEVDAARRCKHSPHGWQHIHPVQDPQGQILEVQAGLRARSDVIGARGDDPLEVDDNRAADQARERSLGLPDTGAAATPTLPKPGSVSSDGAGNGDDAAAARNVRQLADRIVAAVRPPEPAPIHIHTVNRPLSKRVERDPVTGLLTGIVEVEAE